MQHMVYMLCSHGHATAEKKCARMRRSDERTAEENGRRQDYVDFSFCVAIGTQAIHPAIKILPNNVAPTSYCLTGAKSCPKTSHLFIMGRTTQRGHIRRENFKAVSNRLSENEWHAPFLLWAIEAEVVIFGCMRYILVVNDTEGARC